MKNTFAAKTFAADNFAGGAWVGVGIAATIPITETLRRAPAAETGTLRRETETTSSLGRAPVSTDENLYRS
jgi:hypothetical protein